MGRAYVFTLAKTIGKSVFRKPATLMHPEVKREYFPITRGHIYNDIEACIFCGICERKCPTHAITVTKESKEFHLRSLQCVACGVCVEVCPKKCLTMENVFSPAVFASNQGVYYYQQQIKQEAAPPPEGEKE